MAVSVLMGLGLLWSAVAEARPPRHYQQHARPRTRVVVRPGLTVALRIAPWVIGYRPAPRAGYVWIAGYWQGPRYVPGHWQPIAPPPQPDYVWVDGHWEEDTYVDGYWRVDKVDGILWIDGEYENGTYVEGHWEDLDGQPVPEEALPEDVYLPAESESAVDEDVPLAVPVDPGSAEPASEGAPDLHHAPPDRW